MDHAEESSVLTMPPAWLRAELVRAVGIEPTLLAERDFESRASTNSTTPALRHAYSAAIKMRNVKSEQRALFR